MPELLPENLQESINMVLSSSAFVEGFSDIKNFQGRLGPEIEGILFNPKTPDKVPSLQDVAGLFCNVVSNAKGAVPFYEELEVNGKATSAYPTGVTIKIQDYPVQITTDASRCTFEITTPPRSSLVHNESDMKYLFEILSSAAQRSGLELLGLGMHPFAKPDVTNMMPKARYLSMSRRFQEEELRCLTISASSQFHIEISKDSSSHVPYVITGFIPPIIAATGNSAIIGNALSGYKEYRCAMWDAHASFSIEKTRVGIPALFKNPQDYFDYLVSHSPIISKRSKDGKEFYILFESRTQTFSEFVKEGKTYAKRMDTAERMEVTPEPHDLVFLEGTVWPDVRLRSRFGTAEFRPCSFQPSVGEILAIGAVIKGLSNNHKEAFSVLQRYDLKHVKAARASAMKNGLDSDMGGDSILDLCNVMFSIAERGLPKEERRFMDPMRRNVEEGKNPADRSIDMFSKKPSEPSKEKDFINLFVEKHKFKI